MELQRLLRRKEVEYVTGLSRASIYAKMSAKTFPKPVNLGGRAVAWRERDIVEWINSLGELHHRIDAVVPATPQ